MGWIKGSFEWNQTLVPAVLPGFRNKEVWFGQIDDKAYWSPAEFITFNSFRNHRHRFCLALFYRTDKNYFFLIFHRKLRHIGVETDRLQGLSDKPQYQWLIGGKADQRVF